MKFDSICLTQSGPVITWIGPRPTNNISIEFEIWPKFAVRWLKMYLTDHNEILDMWKISLLVEHILN